MVATKAPDGAAAISPWREPWELETNKTQAPDGATANEAEKRFDTCCHPIRGFPFLPIKPPVNTGG